MSIPLHLVTGFLGSGKTSFLKHFLDNNRDKKNIAIIQNEFSPVNVDSKEFQKTEYKILEVNNGSVFCVCLLGSFIDSLSAFIDEFNPDELLMEASGLSDPIGVGQIFQSEKLKGKVFLGHVWSIVDAYNFSRALALKNRVERQLRIADTIIINKIDLIDNKADNVIDDVKKINPFAKILQGTYAKTDVSEMKKALNIFLNSTEEGYGRPDIESVIVKSNREIQTELLTRFLEEIKDEVIRYKGYVKIKNNKTCFVQGVFNNFDIEEVLPISSPTELVIIGNFANEQSFQYRFDEYCMR